MPSAVNRAENVGDLFLMWGDRLESIPLCKNLFLKSLKRLLPVCEEAEKEEKRGDWYFFFLKWLRVFLKMATNGDDTGCWARTFTPARWPNTRTVGNEAFARCPPRPSRPRHLWRHKQRRIRGKRKPVDIRYCNPRSVKQRMWNFCAAFLMQFAGL